MRNGSTAQHHPVLSALYCSTTNILARHVYFPCEVVSKRSVIRATAIAIESAKYGLQRSAPSKRSQFRTSSSPDRVSRVHESTIRIPSSDSNALGHEVEESVPFTCSNRSEFVDVSLTLHATAGSLSVVCCVSD